MDWSAGLGTETFIGSSGRVFPKVMKASPFLRAWLRRLEAQGATLRTRHRLTGFAEDGYVFETPEVRSIVHSYSSPLSPPPPTPP
ncbi:aminoacetone oxidase family FAD-binding enzyme, partial [Rhizobium ruizarguesonis]